MPPPPPTGPARPLFVKQEFRTRLIRLRNPLGINGLELIPTTEPGTAPAPARQELFVFPYPHRGPLQNPSNKRMKRTPFTFRVFFLGPGGAAYPKR